MKLLNKDDIAHKKAQERQREVEEGLKLAKKVDSLREVRAAEEVALHTFRDETLKTIKASIVELEARAAILRAEVVKLEKRKAEALEPLTNLENQLAIKEKLLIALEAELLQRGAVLDTNERNFKKRSTVLAEKEAHTEVMHKDATVLYTNGAKIKSDAERLYREAAGVLQDAHRQADVLIANAIQREAWVTQREQAAFEKEEKLRAEEIRIAHEWTLLRDRQAMLLNDLKTIKQKP